MDVNLLSQTISEIETRKEAAAEKVRRCDKAIAALKELWPELASQIPKLTETDWRKKDCEIEEILAPPARQSPARKRKKSEYSGITSERKAKKLAGEETQRLADLAEQIENNPDRPTSGRTSKSGYKGVHYVPRNRRWRASPWDREDKRIKNIGTYESPELAAAAVQEFIGNHTEARRLRDLTAPSETSPDHVATAPLVPADKVGTVWECNRCGKRWAVAARPGICAACGFQVFVKVNRDGSGRFDLKESLDE